MKKILFCIMIMPIFANYLVIKNLRNQWNLPLSYFNFITDLEIEFGRDSSYAIAVKLWTKKQQKMSDGCKIQGYEVKKSVVNHRDERLSDIDRWLLKYEESTVCIMVKGPELINDFAFTLITENHIVSVYHEF